MPRKRKKENKGLPARWVFHHGAYYYQVPAGQEKKWDGKRKFRLGSNLSEAYRVWSGRLEYIDAARTIGQLLDRYALEVIPTKAAATQNGNHRQIKRLHAVFGHMNLEDIEPRHIYSYADAPARRVQAHREIALLSHAYTKAVEWGYINRHPFKNEVRLTGEAPRDRYVTDDEIISVLSMPVPAKRGGAAVIQAFIRLTLLTGLRRSDVLKLRQDNLRDEGIYVVTSKTSRPVIYEWSDELRAAIAAVKAARPVDISPWLFCTRRGEGYIDEATGAASGWDSMWQRFMERVLTETDVKERFTAHDLRAKAGSDASTLEHARALLAHADSKITRRVYRRKPETVKPLK